MAVPGVCGDPDSSWFHKLLELGPAYYYIFRV